MLRLHRYNRILLPALLILAALLVLRPATVRAAEEDSSLLRIASGEFYDPEEELFVFLQEGNGIRIKSSAANGQVVTGTVSLSADTGVGFTVYRDSEALPASGEYSLSEPGMYLVRLDRDRSEVFRFEILSPETSRKGSYLLPEGFRVLSVTKDGALGSWSRNEVSLSGEGTYHIVTYCEAADRQFVLDIVADHTPPEVTLEGVDGKGFARGPVEITGLRETDTVYAFCDGEALGSQVRLTRSGDYEVLVRDGAGNESRYLFTILVYFPAGKLILVTLALLLLVLLGYRIYHGRNGMKVR